MVYMIDGEKVVLIGKHCLGKVLSFYLFFWIWCTFWFNAGSRIIENDLKVCFFSIFRPCSGALTLQGLILIPLLTLRSKAIFT